MVTCVDCEAASKALWCGFQAGCLGCAARAVSRGPNYRRCLSNGTQDRLYRAELETLHVTHAAVKEAAAADYLSKAPK